CSTCPQALGLVTQRATRTAGSAVVVQHVPPPQSLESVHAYTSTSSLLTLHAAVNSSSVEPRVALHEIARGPATQQTSAPSTQAWSPQEKVRAPASRGPALRVAAAATDEAAAASGGAAASEGADDGACAVASAVGRAASLGENVCGRSQESAR